MELYSSGQINFEKIRNQHFDLIITASGSEKRTYSIIGDYNVSAEGKIVLNSSRKFLELKSPKNKSIFNTENNSFLNLPFNRSSKIVSFLKDFCGSFKKETLNIFIDISCMSVYWLSAVIRFFCENNLEIKYINVSFFYAGVEFFSQKKTIFGLTAESVIYPVKKKSDDEKPVTLIVGLSLESDKTEYIIKYINPSQLFLKYADPAFNPSYVATVLKNNKNTIEKVEMRNLLNYPLNNPDLLYASLNNLCLGLRLNYRVIIASLGPKIFSLISLLLNISYPDIDVWNVKALNEKYRCKKEVITKPLIYQVNYINDDHTI